MEHKDLQPSTDLSQMDAPDTLELLKSLQSENTTLRMQLDQMIHTAAENERIWLHFIEIERILFRTRQLEQLVEELLNEIKVRFQLDVVMFLITHPDILERFFPETSAEAISVGENIWIVPKSSELNACLGESAAKPLVLSAEEIETFRQHLPDGDLPLESGVLVPLCIHEMSFGALFLASKSPERYQRDDGTALLEQLGTKTALCLDNCLIYERVKDIAVQDKWTGLLSFFQVHTILEQQFRKARRLGAPLAVLIISIDFYEMTNGQPNMGAEIFGHVASILKELFTADDGYIGRYGSHEFVAVLPDTSLEDAEEVARYLSQIIRKSPFRYENTAVLIHPKIASIALDDDLRRPQEMLDAAYIKLCRLKMLRYPHVDRDGKS